MELKDTIELMNSSDYKDRFKAEYYQTKIRYEKLHAMLIKYHAGLQNGDVSKYLGFEPKCSISVLTSQEMYMKQYLDQLSIRAEIEGIVL